MANWSKPQPVDTAGAAIVNSPAPFKALNRYSSENAVNSSVITLTDNTVEIEVAAINGAAVIRWVPASETAGVAPFGSVISAATGANFDHAIVTGETRRFTVPKETWGPASVVGANIQNGLYRRVAWKTVGAASILATEY